MQKKESGKKMKLLNQAVRFIGISGIGWIIDFCTYTILGAISNNLVLNNTISSWFGVTFVFIFSSRKVFKSNSHISIKWKYIIYILYQCILIFFMSKLLKEINLGIIQNIHIDFILRFSSLIAKILVTPITMVLNFLVMKSVIEKL